MQPNSDIFEEISNANIELSQAMYATYMMRRFASLGIVAQYVQRDGVFSHIKIEAKEDLYIEIRPVVTYEEGTRIEEPMMRWQTFPDKVRKALPESHPGGFYLYKASFTLFHDDFDPESPENEAAEHSGPGEIATISVNCADFQEFFFTALYTFAQSYEVEVFPKMRRCRVEL